MKRVLAAAVFCIGFGFAGLAAATEVWTGPAVNFSKASFAEFTLAQNQDRLTANVWLTRGNDQGIFNIQQESEYQRFAFISPIDTEWAFGSIATGIPATFDDWESTIKNRIPGDDPETPPSAVGHPMVVHLISDDIYLDLTMTAWGQQGGGGGLISYTRSSPALTVTSQQVPTLPWLAFGALALALTWLERAGNASDRTK